MSDLKKQFLEECNVDLTDFEYVGKFPAMNKAGVWGNIPRGEGYKRYSEWQAKQIAELKEALIKIADFCDNKGVISDIAKQALK